MFPPHAFGRLPQRPLATIQKSQANRDAKQDCASCHQQVFPALAFRLGALSTASGLTKRRRTPMPPALSVSTPTSSGR